MPRGIAAVGLRASGSLYIVVHFHVWEVGDRGDKGTVVCNPAFFPLRDPPASLQVCCQAVPGGRRIRHFGSCPSADAQPGPNHCDGRLSSSCGGFQESGLTLKLYGSLELASGLKHLLKNGLRLFCPTD